MAVPGENARQGLPQLSSPDYWEAWSVDCWYMCVLCRELLNCNWKSRDKEKLAPNVCRLIRRTNEVRRWYLVTMVTWKPGY